MRRFFTFLLGALAMAMVALVSAFLAMRLAIHGREVEVPALTGLTLADAARVASQNGLNLTLENRFYSPDVTAGRILAQSPGPGSRVRRDWPVRITESLGAQHISIPDLTGQSERAATISIRRLSLEQGVVAHLPIAGDPDVVLAQTPRATSAGVTGPRVSLLVSDPAQPEPSEAWVMPSLVGLSSGTASARISAMGLRLAVVVPEASTPYGAGVASPPAAAMSGGSPISAPGSSAAQGGPGATVIAQNPLPGRRINRGELVHISLGRSGGLPTGQVPGPGNAAP